MSKITMSGCFKVKTGNTVKSWVTNKVFATVDSNQYLDCDSSNLVYLITCRRCNMIYVGETKRSLKRHCSEHLYNIKNNKNSSFLVSHFNSKDHSIHDVEIQILEKLPDSTFRKDRELREDFWIRALVSAFPFGLNDKIKGYGTVSQGLDPIVWKNHPYFCLKMPPKVRIHGHGKRRRSC